MTLGANRVIASLAGIALLLGQIAPTYAADAASPPTHVRLEQGRLQGQLVDAQGQPVAGEEVALIQEMQLIAKTKTNGEGRFAVSQVRDGKYHLIARNSLAAVHAEDAAVAGPTAQSSVLLVKGQTVVRGQIGGPSFMALAAVAGMLSIPAAIAVSTSGDDKPAATR